MKPFPPSSDSDDVCWCLILIGGAFGLTPLAVIIPGWGKMPWGELIFGLIWVSFWLLVMVGGIAGLISERRNEKEWYQMSDDYRLHYYESEEHADWQRRKDNP